MGSDAALTLKMNVAVGISLSGMNHPINSDRIVLQTELSPIPLWRWRSLADEAQADAWL